MRPRSPRRHTHTAVRMSTLLCHLGPRALPPCIQGSPPHLPHTQLHVVTLHRVLVGPGHPDALPTERQTVSYLRHPARPDTEVWLVGTAVRTVASAHVQGCTHDGGGRGPATSQTVETTESRPPSPRLRLRGCLHTKQRALRSSLCFPPLPSCWIQHSELTWAWRRSTSRPPQPRRWPS